ncbi:MAG TPA: SDR family oxidoreductase [Burkholderiales bacterium]|nr:SDR family oxidoreductase [Burkholderiales bacterium]
MPTALITGATGFIGQAACKQLLVGGWQVKGTIRSVSQNVSNLPFGVTPCSVDSLGPGTDWQAALHGIDVIVHLAARVHIMKETAEDSFLEFRQVNTHATERLGRMAAQTGVKRRVFLSTMKINGEESVDHPFTEADTPAPQDAYAVSKWEAEQALKRVAAETGLEVVILRPPLVYGAGVKGNFLRLLQAVAKGIPLPLASVNNRKSLIFLGNLVDAILTCMTHPQAAGGTYLLSKSEDVSSPDLIVRIARALGRPARLWPLPPALLRIGAGLIGKSNEAVSLLDSLQVDTSKICQELGWKPRYPVTRGLEETARWFLSDPEVAAS